MVKRVMANFYGHEIVVENRWFSGAKLFVDGECCDENRDWISVSQDRPLLKANLEIDGEPRTIEVFVVALLTVQIKICVSGKQIGGEMF